MEASYDPFPFLVGALEARQLGAFLFVSMLLLTAFQCFDIAGQTFCIIGGNCVHSGPSGNPTPPPYSWTHYVDHSEQDAMSSSDASYWLDASMTAHAIRSPDSWFTLFYPKRRMELLLEETCGIHTQEDASYNGNIPSSPYAVHLSGEYATGIEDCWTLSGRYQEIFRAWEYEWENSDPGGYPHTEARNSTSVKP